MRKSFSEIFTPAISRRNTFTSRARTRRDSPSSARYWNSRRPGSVAQHVRARPRARGHLNSFATVLPPLPRNRSAMRRAVDRDVRFQQRRGAARAALPWRSSRARHGSRCSATSSITADERQLARRLGSRQDAGRRCGGCAAALPRGAADGAPCAARAPFPSPDDSGTAAGRRRRARPPADARPDRSA